MFNREDIQNAILSEKSYEKNIEGKIINGFKVLKTIQQGEGYKALLTNPVVQAVIPGSLIYEQLPFMRAHICQNESNPSDVRLVFMGSVNLAYWGVHNPPIAFSGTLSSEAKKFAENVYHQASAFISEPKKISFTATGHSFGGALAAWISLKFGIGSTTFDKPGLNGLLKEFNENHAHWKLIKPIKVKNSPISNCNLDPSHKYARIIDLSKNSISQASKLQVAYQNINPVNAAANLGGEMIESLLNHAIERINNGMKKHAMPMIQEEFYAHYVKGKINENIFRDPLKEVHDFMNKSFKIRFESKNKKSVKEQSDNQLKKQYMEDDYLDKMGIRDTSLYKVCYGTCAKFIKENKLSNEEYEKSYIARIDQCISDLNEQNIDETGKEMYSIIACRAFYDAWHQRNNLDSENVEILEEFYDLDDLKSFAEKIYTDIELSKQKQGDFYEIFKNNLKSMSAFIKHAEQKKIAEENLQFKETIEYCQIGFEGSSLIAKVCGNKQLSAQIKSLGSSLVSVSTGLARFFSGEITGLLSVFSGLDTFCDIIGGDENLNAYEFIAEQLDFIRQDIFELRQYLAENFNHLLEILKTHHQKILVALSDLKFDMEDVLKLTRKTREENIHYFQINLNLSNSIYKNTSQIRSDMGRVKMGSAQEKLASEIQEFIADEQLCDQSGKKMNYDNYHTKIQRALTDITYASYSGVYPKKPTHTDLENVDSLLSADFNINYLKFYLIEKGYIPKTTSLLPNVSFWHYIVLAKIYLIYKQSDPNYLKSKKADLNFVIETADEIKKFLLLGSDRSNANIFPKLARDFLDSSEKSIVLVNNLLSQKLNDLNNEYRSDYIASLKKQTVECSRIFNERLENIFSRPAGATGPEYVPYAYLFNIADLRIFGTGKITLPQIFSGISILGDERYVASAIHSTLGYFSGAASRRVEGHTYSWTDPDNKNWILNYHVANGEAGPAWLNQMSKSKAAIYRHNFAECLKQMDKNYSVDMFFTGSTLTLK